jgi:hypothetical protein
MNKLSSEGEGLGLPAHLQMPIPSNKRDLDVKKFFFFGCFYYHL